MDNTLNKRTGILLIVLTFLAIIGIAITQIYWIKNAYELKKTQLDQRIQVGLRSVSNTLFELQNAGENNNIFLTEHPKNCPTHIVFEDLNY